MATHTEYAKHQRRPRPTFAGHTESSNTNNFSVHYYRVKSLDWREGLRPIQPLHFSFSHTYKRGSWAQWGIG